MLPFEGCADISDDSSSKVIHTTYTVGDICINRCMGSDLASCAMYRYTDETLKDYDAAANSDDGSCEYAQTGMPMDQHACWL